MTRAPAKVLDRVRQILDQDHGKSYISVDMVTTHGITLRAGASELGKAATDKSIMARRVLYNDKLPTIERLRRKLVARKAAVAVDSSKGTAEASDYQ